jgi:hypothetical protein
VYLLNRRTLQVEIISAKEPRRRWSEDEKRQLSAYHGLLMRRRRSTTRGGVA